MVRVVERPDGEVEYPLSNFVASIVADVIVDDGSGQVTREVELQIVLNEHQSSLRLPMPEFATMHWPIEQLGSGAIVYPGLNGRDHLRTAIQVLSVERRELRIYSHTGWRRCGRQSIYLHAGGAIGGDGEVPAIAVRLPTSLTNYSLPTPPEGDERTRAVRASLGLLELAGLSITVPLLAGVYRAVLNSADFALWLVGPTGVFKTELTALLLQHFGLGLDARHLPANWSSTDNALEYLAFQAKDTLLAIDDFAPCGTAQDVQRLHQKADRVLRGQGNQSGRQRLNRTADLTAARVPRGTILGSGEDTPRGESLNARLLVVEIEPGAILSGKLSHAQADAEAGLFAAAMAAYIQWIATDYEAVLRRFVSRTAELRTLDNRSGGHRRTPSNIAQLQAAFELFIEFAQQVDVITLAEANDLLERGAAALGALAGLQPQHQSAGEPVQRFFELLTAALTSGAAHLASAEGQAPEHTTVDAEQDYTPAGLGWRREPADGAWRPLGARVGWVREAQVYLNAEAAYQVVQRVAREQSEPYSIRLTTLKKRLAEKGLLRSTDLRGGRTRYEVRQTLDGSRRTVLHLDVDLFLATDVAQVAQMAQHHLTVPEAEHLDEQTGLAPDRSGPLAWATAGDRPSAVVHASGPPEATAVKQPRASGPRGPRGPRPAPGMHEADDDPASSSAPKPARWLERSYDLH